jgi:hypothetical protein
VLRRVKLVTRVERCTGRRDVRRVGDVTDARSQSCEFDGKAEADTPLVISAGA